MTTPKRYPMQFAAPVPGEDRLIVQSELVGLVDQCRIQTGPTVPTAANQIFSLGFVLDDTVTINAAVNVATTSYQILDKKGNPISNVLNNTTQSNVLTLGPGSYRVRIVTGAIVAINTLVMRFGASVTPTVFSFFENGFNINPVSGITASADANGTTTFTLMNKQIVKDVDIILGTTGKCLQAGTLNVTPSDLTAIQLISVPTTPEAAYVLIASPLKTATVSMTIVVSVAGVGVESAINLNAVPYLPDSNERNSKFVFPAPTNQNGEAIAIDDEESVQSELNNLIKKTESTIKLVKK